MAEARRFTDEEMLDLLKINLNKPAAYVNSLLELKLNAAIEMIEGSGIRFDRSSYRDVELAVAYASWLYGLKNEDPEKTKMPRMLQIMLHDRILHESGLQAEMEAGDA